MTSTEAIRRDAATREALEADIALVRTDRTMALRLGYTVEMIAEAEARIASADVIR